MSDKTPVAHLTDTEAWTYGPPFSEDEGDLVTATFTQAEVEAISSAVSAFVTSIGELPASLFPIMQKGGEQAMRASFRLMAADFEQNHPDGLPEMFRMSPWGPNAQKAEQEDTTDAK